MHGLITRQLPRIDGAASNLLEIKRWLAAVIGVNDDAATAEIWHNVSLTHGDLQAHNTSRRDSGKSRSSQMMNCLQANADLPRQLGLSLQ